MRVLLVAAVVVAWCAPAWADANETVDGGAHVTKVDGKIIAIDRGARAGIQVGLAGDVYPFHVREGSESISVDVDVRLAIAKVTAVADDSATLALDAVAGTVEVGAFFQCKLSIPSSAADSPLVRVLARGIELVSMVTDKPFVTFETALADKAARDKALDAMIAEVQGIRAIVVDAFPDPPSSGIYRGKSPGAIIDKLDRAQLTAFLEFMDAYAITYLGQRFKIPDLFFNWVYAGTQSGEQHRRLRGTKATEAKALDLLKAGKLDEARVLYASLLKEWADYPNASETLAQIDQALVLKRAVAADGDDTGSAFALMELLYKLGANETAIALVGPLQKHSFDPVKLERQRGLCLVALERWSAAKDAFEAISKAHPDDTELSGWASVLRMQAKAAAAPADAAAQLDLAALLLTREDFDAAVATYRKVLGEKTASAKQREAAAKGQQNVSLAKQLQLLVEWGRDDIATHDVGAARTRLTVILKVAGMLGDHAGASSALEQLADQARKVDEQDLAIELMRKRVELAPTDRTAFNVLAFALLTDDRLDEAETLAKQSLTKQGEVSRANLVLAHIARMRGNLADAEKFATQAATDKTYPWPRVVLARTAAAAGDWERANTLARKALEREPTASETRTTVTATARGLLAFEALRANPKSARERLRLVRALADLGLVKRARDEIAKLPRDGTWRSEGSWALATSTDVQMLLADRVAAAHEAKATTAQRKRTVAMLDAREQLRKKSTDEAARLTLAKLYVEDGRYHLALATLAPLVKRPLPPAVVAVRNAAVTALPLEDQLQVAWAAYGRAEHDTALRLALAVEQAYDTVGSPSNRMSARQLHGEVLAQLGRYPEATKVLDEARAIAVAEGDDKKVVSFDRLLANFRATTGTSEGVAAALERARSVCADADDEWCEHWAEKDLATLEQDEGRLAASLDHSRAAWTLADRLGRPDVARLDRVQYALVALNANRISDGEAAATKLLADSRAAGDTTVEQASVMLLGSVALLHGDGPKARARFLEVYDLGTRHGMTAWRATARRFEGLAWIEADHDPAKAAVAFEQAVELYSLNASAAAVSERGTSLRRLAEARLQAGDVAGAKRAAEEGFALAQKGGRNLQLATAHWVLALIALTEAKPDDAVTRAKQAVAVAEKTDAVTVLWNAYYVLARAYELKKQDKDALPAYESALRYLGNAVQAAGNDSERTGYMNVGRVREVYRNAIELMLKLGMTTRAREVLELSRDAMLSQTFDATKVATQDAAVQALLGRFDAARDRLNALQYQLEKAVEKRNDKQRQAIADLIAKARQELDDVASQLKTSDRQLFQALTMAPQEIAARAPSLPKGTVVVEYFVAADTLSIFATSPTRKEPALVRVKVTGADLAKAVDEYRDAVVGENARVKKRDQVEALGRKLAGWLLQPIKKELDGANTVVIVPFGALYYVPFDALVTSEAGKPLRYAIEDYRIAVQTTWTLEALMKPARVRSTGRMLAIANPDGSLPGAQAEVSRIMKTAVPDAQVLGKDGTIKKVQDLAGTSRYLHIATHGILDADPRKSYLKLADGQLTVQDISVLKGLRTNNDLVVLSACNTATEVRDSAGDDLVSLASSFALAGAPTVVASLWEVSDDSTAELMATFYRALEQKNGDRLDALRTAKLNLLRMETANDHPYAAPWHWASFQLYGDFRAPAAK